MTNLEKLKTLPADAFWKEIRKLANHTLREYIGEDGYIAYLNSESTNLLDFVKHEGNCRVRPSEAELMMHCNEANMQSRALTESEKLLYIAEHTKTMLMLKRGIFRFGEPYVTVYDMEHEILMNVPESLVEN